MRKLKTHFLLIFIAFIIQGSLIDSTVISTDSNFNEENNPLKKVNKQEITNSINDNYHLHKNIILNDYEYTSDLIINHDKQGNLYTLGQVKRGTTSFDNIMLIKWDSNGTKFWERQWNYNGMDVRSLSSLKIDSNGTIYSIGSAYDTSESGQIRCLLSKLDSNGIVLWNQFYYTIDEHSQIPFEGEGIEIDQFGNVFITGSVGRTWSGGSIPYVFIAKYKSNGTLLWSNRTSSIFTFTPDLKALSKDIITDNDGNAYVLAEYSASTYLLKYSSTGNKLWQKAWSGAYNYNEFLFVDNIGNVYMIGDNSIGSFNPQGSQVSEIALESSQSTFMDLNHAVYTLKSETTGLQFHKWDLNGIQANDYNYNYVFASTSQQITDFVVNQYITYAVGTINNYGFLAIFNGTDIFVNSKTGTTTTNALTTSYQMYSNNNPNNSDSLSIILITLVVIGLALGSGLYLFSKRANKIPPNRESRSNSYNRVTYENIRPTGNEYRSEDLNVVGSQKFCTNCGSSVVLGDVFCQNCGKRLL